MNSPNYMIAVKNHDPQLSTILPLARRGIGVAGVLLHMGLVKFLRFTGRTVAGGTRPLPWLWATKQAFLSALFPLYARIRRNPGGDLVLLDDIPACTETPLSKEISDVDHR
jgi:hypothetical protein